MILFITAAHPTSPMQTLTVPPVTVSKINMMKIPSPRRDVQDSWDSDLRDLLTSEPDDEEGENPYL